MRPRWLEQAAMGGEAGSDQDGFPFEQCADKDGDLGAATPATGNRLRLPRLAWRSAAACRPGIPSRPKLQLNETKGAT